MAQQGGVITFPTPAYQNVPIESQFYQPSRFVVENITLGRTTTVTTTEDHNYVIGQDCRLLIPASFGSYQLNEVKGNVLSIPSSNQVELSIDSSRNVNAYIASSVTYPSVAQIIAVGDYNSGQQNTNGRTNQLTHIPGSFINLSPL